MAILIGSAFQYLILLFLLPRFFSIEQVGLFRNYTSLISIFSTIGTFSINYAVILNLNTYPEKTLERKRYNFGTFFMALVFSILVFVFLNISKDIVYSRSKSSSPIFLSFFWCIPWGASLLVLTNYFEAYSNATFRVTVPNVVKEILFRLVVLLGIFLYGANKIDLEGFYGIYVFAYAFIALVLFIYIYKVRGYRLQYSMRWFKTKDFKQQFAFMFLSSIASITAIIITTLDPIIYNLIGPKPTAIYGIAITLSAFMFLPYKALSQIVTPTLKEAWKKNDIQKIDSINKTTANNLTFIGMLFFVLVLASFNNILYKIDPQYLNAKWAFIIICVARAFDYSTGTNTEILFTSPSYKKVTYFIILCLPFHFLFSYLLIPKFGVNGAALVVAFNITLYNVFKLYFLYKEYKIFPVSKNSFYIILVFLGIYWVQLALPFLYNWIVDAIVRSIVVAVLGIAVVYVLKLVPELNVNLNKYIFRKN